MCSNPQYDGLGANGSRGSASAALTAAVDTLAGAELGELGVRELQALIASVSGEVDRLRGVLSAGLGELSARSGGVVPDGPNGESTSLVRWLREATTASPQAAGWALRTAVALRELPAVADAVRAGRIGAEQAGVLTRLVEHLEPAQLQECQDQLIELAGSFDPVGLGRVVRHLLDTYCEPALEDAERRAHDRRYLQLIEEADGSVRGRFALPVGPAESVRVLIEALSRREPGADGLADSRSAAQRRADALVEGCEIALAHAGDGELGSYGGVRPQISYVLPAAWAAQVPPPPLSDLLAAELGKRAGAAGSGAVISGPRLDAGGASRPTADHGRPTDGRPTDGRPTEGRPTTWPWREGVGGSVLTAGAPRRPSAAR